MVFLRWAKYGRFNEETYFNLETFLQFIRNTITNEFERREVCGPKYKT